MSHKSSTSLNPSATILSPTISETFADFEYSAHVTPKSLFRDLKTVFPDVTLTTTSPVYVLPTFQKSSVILLEYGEEQALEKDRLLERFFAWSQLVFDAIKRLEPSAWADGTDPASGMAWKGASGSCYSDVDGIIRLLRYETMDAGGCRVVSHPQWRHAVYPATFFTNASEQTLIKALDEVNKGHVAQS